LLKYHLGLPAQKNIHPVFSPELHSDYFLNILSMAVSIPFHKCQAISSLIRLNQSTYTTGGSLDVPHIIMQGDARRRRNENYLDDIPRSKLERQMAQYLGSMLIKELRGTESTQDACAKMRNIIAEHEIRNISCAAQDPEDLSTFAYITKDLKSNHHYCHVFTAFD
ncbi:hypothetical protein A6R68_03382, partial [Neotoma lepida]